MKELRELEIFEKLSVLSEGKTKDGNVMKVLVPWIQADRMSSNRRKYSKALLQREIARIQKDVEEGGFLGTADHSASGLADLAIVSHIVEKVWMDGSGKGWAALKVLPTSKGKNIQTVIHAGGRLGISARGFGNVDEKTGEVKDDYKLFGLGVVINPSFKDATFTKANVFESIDFSKREDPEDDAIQKELKRQAGLEKAADGLLRATFDKKLDEGVWQGSWESYRKAYEPYVREAMGLDPPSGKNQSEKKKLVRKKVEPRDIWPQARIAGINAIEYAKRVNESIEREEEVEADKDFSVEERKRILEQARLAGMDIFDESVREKILRIRRGNKTEKFKPKTLTEKEEKVQLAGLKVLQERLAGGKRK